MPSTTIDGGDHLVGVERHRGTLKTGAAPLDPQYCHVYGFREGRVADFQLCADTEHRALLMR